MQIVTMTLVPARGDAFYFVFDTVDGGGKFSLLLRDLFNNAKVRPIWIPAHECMRGRHALVGTSAQQCSVCTYIMLDILVGIKEFAFYACDPDFDSRCPGVSMRGRGSFAKPFYCHLTAR